MIEKLAKNYILKDNYINKDAAIDHSVVGLKIFDSPIVGYATATDKLFDSYKARYEITYHQFMTPKEWLESAKTVISIFFPYSNEVKEGNNAVKKMPSKEWLHGRIEGQKIINDCTKHIVDSLILAGYDAVSPCIDERFSASVGTWKDLDRKLSNKDYYSNWSERHVAFAAGLGTFGLSKGIITKKGMAGRFSSIITDYEHDITNRTYKEIYENCIMCGACIEKCPVKAITFENGKDHTKCSHFVDYTGVKFKPRYGCGKCQVGVPCSSEIPTKASL